MAPKQKPGRENRYSGCASEEIDTVRVGEMVLLVPDYSRLITKSGASLVAQTVENPLSMWVTGVLSLGWEDPLEESRAIHSSILAWRIPTDRGAWRAAVHGVTESDTTEQLSAEQRDN